MMHTTKWYTNTAATRVNSTRLPNRARIVSLINFFIPLSFFLLCFSLVNVVLAFLLLDNVRDLTLLIQRTLGIWFAGFGVVLGILSLFIGVATVGGIGLGAPAAVPVFFFLIIWVIAIAFLNAFGAYFLLFFWSASVDITYSHVVRGLAFGSDSVKRESIERIVEVIYLYTVKGDTVELTPRSIFVMVFKNRNLLFRYALFRPYNAFVEEQFREKINDVLPIEVTTVPGFPKLPRIAFRPFDANIYERKMTKKRS